MSSISKYAKKVHFVHPKKINKIKIGVRDFNKNLVIKLQSQTKINKNVLNQKQIKRYTSQQ